MKFIIDKDQFLKHITIAQRAISQRSPLEILEAIKITAANERIRLVSTDTELTIISECPCTVVEDGTCCFSNKLLSDIVRKVPSGDISFTSNGDDVEIKAKFSKFELKSMPHDDYPEIDTHYSLDKSVKLTMKELNKIIKKTLFSTSQDQARPTLCGVYFKFEDGVLSAASLDGYRISSLKFNVDVKENSSFIVPYRTLAEIQKMLDDTDDIVEITYARDKAVFKIDRALLYTRLIEGDFFNYEEVFASEDYTTVEINRMDLINAIERVSLIGFEDRISLIVMEFKDNNLNIAASNEIGSATDDIMVEKTGDDIKIGFNGRYVLEGLKAMSADKLTLKLSESIRPMKIYEGEEYRYLVLPVKMQA